MPILVDHVSFPIVDAHTHLGRRAVPLGHGTTSYLGEDLVRNMDAAGLDRAVAFPLGAPTTDYSEANALIAEQVARFPDRIVGYGRLNPSWGGPDAAARAAEHALATLGLRGLKLHPEIEFFDPNEMELMEPIYEAARRHRVPIIFHSGMSHKASPGVIAEGAARYPDVPVILGHMGVAEASKQAMSVAFQRENVYLETSVVGWMPILAEAFRKVGSTKILYGSDHPYNPFPMEIAKIAEHARKALGLTHDDLRRVLAGNLLQILGE